MCAGSLTLVVADLPIRLECKNQRLLEILAGQYANFLGDRPDGFVVWIDEQADGRGNYDEFPPVVFNKDRIAVYGPGYQGDINIKDSQASLKISHTKPEQGIDYFLRLICAFLVFRSGGIMLHGAGIVRNHLTHIFFGKSGSGKTTVSRLTTDGIVLNDDLVVLLPDGGRWIAYATPFTNATQVEPSAMMAPVLGIYRLVQDQNVYLEKMSRAVAVAELVASVPVVASDPQHTSALVKRCKTLVDACPIFSLHFRKDTDFWRVIEK